MADKYQFPLEQQSAQDVQNGRFAQVVENNTQVDILQTAVDEPLDFQHFAICTGKFNAAAWSGEWLPVQVIKHGYPLRFCNTVTWHQKIQELQQLQNQSI